MVTTFVVQCTFVHIIVVLYRPFGIWRVLMKRWLRSSATSSWMEMCFLITSALSLSLRQEKGGVTCHMTGVMCHLYRVTVSQQRNADTDTIRWS